MLQFSFHLFTHFLLFFDLLLLGLFLLEASNSKLTRLLYYVCNEIIFYRLRQVLHIIDIDEPNLSGPVSDHESVDSLKTHSSQVSDFLEVAVLT